MNPEKPNMPGTEFQRHLLNGLDQISNAPDNPPALSSRLASLADMNQSIELAKRLMALKHVKHEPSEALEPIALRPAVNAARFAMECLIQRAMNAQGGVRQRFPQPEWQPDGQAERPATSKMQRLYSYLQSEMEFRFQALLAECRGQLKSQSRRLAQAMVLDEALDHLTQNYARKQLARVPGLVGQVYDRLCPENEFHADGYERFREWFEAQLNAELNLRLMPILGLVETIETLAPRNPTC